MGSLNSLASTSHTRCGGKERERGERASRERETATSSAFGLRVYCKRTPTRPDFSPFLSLSDFPSPARKLPLFLSPRVSNFIYAYVWACVKVGIWGIPLLVYDII